MYLWLSDYMADTAGYVYQKAGVLQYQMTPENTHVSQDRSCLSSLCVRTLVIRWVQEHMGAHSISWASN